jgi:hypothetical protein
MAFNPDQHLALLFGIVSVLVVIGGYFLRRCFGPESAS